MDLTLSLFLGRIKDEAERLLRLGGLSDRRDAYREALISVVLAEAEGNAVTPFEARLIGEIRRIQAGQGGRPVSTVQLSMALRDNRDPMSRFTLYNHLNKLEGRGLLTRPAGPKSGWGVPRDAVALSRKEAR